MYRWSPYYKRYVWSPYKSSSYYNSYYDYRRPYSWSPYYNSYYDYSRPYRYSYGKYRYRLPCYYYYNSPYYYSKNKWYPYYWYYYRPYYNRYFDDTYVELKTRMDLFKDFLKSIPKNRSELVNELEITDDLLKNRPYVNVEEESLSSRSVSPQAYSDDLNIRPLRSVLSTGSEMSLSRALTDSEIDYEYCRRMTKRNLSDPFCDLRTSLAAFPKEYLVSADSLPAQKPEPQPAPPIRERPYYNEDLLNRMRDFFDEECRVFHPDDPSLLELEDALKGVDI